MPRTICRSGLLLLMCLAATMVAAQVANPAAQTPASQAPQTAANHPKIENPGRANGPKPPDMVCFGYYPSWSVQFGNGEARYLGINEPDQYFKGDFYWVEADKVWEWHRAARVAPSEGGSSLSATIRKEACNDPLRQTSYPYSADVYLSQGDMVSGCCRKLLSGEAPIGRHAVPPSAAGATSMPAHEPAQQAR